MLQLKILLICLFIVSIGHSQVIGGGCVYSSKVDKLRIGQESLSFTSHETVALNCTTEFAIIGTINFIFDLSLVFQPHQFVSQIQRNLCQYKSNSPVWCSHSSLFYIFAALNENLQRDFPLLTEWSYLYSTYKLLNYQFLENCRHSPEFQKTNDLSVYRWYPISIALILDASSLLHSRSDDNAHFAGFYHLLTSIAIELPDLSRWTQVKLYLGYFNPHGETEEDAVNDNDNTWRQKQCETLIELVANIMPKLDVTCVEITTDKVISNSALSTDILQQHNAEQNENIDQGDFNASDIREIVAREAYNRDDMNYYILVDTVVSNFNTRFITPAFTSLCIFENALGGHVGARFVDAKLIATEANEGDENRHDDTTSDNSAESPQFTPLQPAFHKSHFQLFPTHNAFNPLFGTKLNNMLLYDLYSAVQSVDIYSSYGLRNDEHDYAVFNHFLLEYPDYPLLERYIDHIQPLRRQLLMALNSDMYYGNKIEWTLQDTAYQNGDLLYTFYCDWAEGCVTHHSAQTTKITSQSRNTGDSSGGSALDKHNSHNRHSRQRSTTTSRTKVAFVTAIYGSYETTLKSAVRQTIPADFICFTDNPELEHHTHHNEWIIDTHPYHLEALHWEIENNATHYVNSLHNNQHPFNIAKYYKLNFHNISRLAQYDVVVWLDGTIEVHNEHTAEIVYDLIVHKNKNIVAVEGDFANTTMAKEMERSLHGGKYMSHSFLDLYQPIQNVTAQYAHYIAQGYNDDNYWANVAPNRPYYGRWVTCFVAFKMHTTDTATFLNMWSQQNREFSTQDQISFPYVVQRLKRHPYSLPDRKAGVFGNQYANNLFVKYGHGAHGNMFNIR